MASVTTEVEVDVDLDDFDDDEIAAEYEARGLGDESSDAGMVAQIRWLVAANNMREAIILIERLFAPLGEDKQEAFAAALKNRDPATGRPLIL